MMSLSRVLIIASAGLCIAGCSTPSSSRSPASQTPDFPDVITVERGGFTPEGIDYDHVTDSFAVVVYKVDTDGVASVFVTRDKFPDNQSINGIISHPDGYLLIAGSGTGVLYKVDVRDPESFASVGLPEKFPGIDGMVWDANGNLVMTTSGRTVALSSRDNWVSAQIVFAVPQGPASTVARVGAALYVVHPHFADQDPPTVEKVSVPNP
jgi:sugar lactone lactonase YvrE